MRSATVPRAGLDRRRFSRTRASLAATLAALAWAAAAPGPALAQPGAASGKKSGNEPMKGGELSLAVGENRTIPAGDVKQYSEGTPGVVDVRLTPDGTKFVVVGQKPGSTTLLFIKNDGSQFTWTLNVFSKSPDLVEKELSQLLDGYTGLRVRRVGPRLFIEGGVANEAEKERIKQVALLYGGQVEALVTVGTGAIDRKINIRLDFFFVQYNKSSSYGVGINWPARYGGQDFTELNANFDFVNQTGGATAAIVNQPLPGLDLASNYGWAKVLKQATVITTNGNRATFGNGGEVNFPVTSGFAASIESINFGTHVTVLPRFDPTSRNLEVQVDADVADLTPPTNGIPGRQSSKLSTLVFLKLGQSLVLSGIRTRGERHGISGLPLLSRIPVLGVFFGSHSNALEEIEGAVFIIPSVVESVPKATFDILKDAMQQYEEFSGDMDDVNAFAKTPPDDAPEDKKP